MKRFLVTPDHLKATAVSTVSVSEPNDPGSSASISSSDKNKQLNLKIFDISLLVDISCNL